jgi:hypothetical protein
VSRRESGKSPRTIKLGAFRHEFERAPAAHFRFQNLDMNDVAVADGFQGGQTAKARPGPPCAVTPKDTTGSSRVFSPSRQATRSTENDGRCGTFELSPFHLALLSTAQYSHKLARNTDIT